MPTGISDNKASALMVTAQYTHNSVPYEICVLASEADKAPEILVPFQTDEDPPDSEKLSEEKEKS
jgi:hypothetical protein